MDRHDREVDRDDVVWTVERIVSGGQTGADRAALDWAIAHGIAHGGWCPCGRRAEDGRIDDRYLLQETPSADYAQRTEWNVRDSDGTVVFSISPQLTDGSLLTVQLAAQYDKPSLHLYRDHNGQCYGATLLAFLGEYDIRVLNVAGPRASTELDVGPFVTRVLDEAWHVGEKGAQKSQKRSPRRRPLLGL